MNVKCSASTIVQESVPIEKQRGNHDLPGFFGYSLTGEVVTFPREVRILPVPSSRHP